MVKKLGSLLIAISMLTLLCTNAFAATQIKPERREIQEVIADLEKKLPGAEIRVVDETIHIVISDPSDVQMFAVNTVYPLSSGRVTSVVSSEGGTFTNFDVPYYMLFQGNFAPHVQSYMPQEIVETIKFGMTYPDIYDFILECFQLDYTQEYIQQLILATFGVSVPIGIIVNAYVIIDFVLSILDYTALISAQGHSAEGKVSVVRGTTDGYYSNIYYAWEGNVCSTYAGLDADWNPGVYAI